MNTYMVNYCIKLSGSFLHNLNSQKIGIINPKLQEKLLNLLKFFHLKILVVSVELKKLKKRRNRNQRRKFLMLISFCFMNKMI